MNINTINAELDLLSQDVYQEKTELMYEEMLNDFELLKQFEAMLYADAMANDDAIYYGE